MRQPAIILTDCSCIVRDVVENRGRAVIFSTNVCLFDSLHRIISESSYTHWPTEGGHPFVQTAK